MGSLNLEYKNILRNDGEVIISKFENGDEIIDSQRSNVKNYLVSHLILKGVYHQLLST